MSLYNQALIKRALVNFSDLTGISTMEMVVSASGAFVMAGLQEDCSNLDIEVPPTAFARLSQILTKGYCADPFPMWHPRAGKPFKVYRLEGNFNVMMKTDPEENFGTTMERDGDHIFCYRTMHSAIALKSWLGRAKDIKDIARIRQRSDELVKQACENTVD